jgi:hypothetical protein
MKYTCIGEIYLPIKKVVELYFNTGTFNKWQDGFVSKELIIGNAGQRNAKSRIIMSFRNKQMELIETIQSNDLPNRIIALYEHKHMINIMITRFKPVNGGKTEISVDIIYTKFIGFIPKLMALVMPGIFKKQTQKMINNFKAFAESSQ